MKKLLILPLLIWTLETIAGDGTLRFSIVEDNNLSIPGKLVFLQNGNEPDFGLSSTKEIATRKNVIYTRTGSGEVRIPAGTYEIWAGHGMEYSSFQTTVIIREGQTSDIKVILERVVDTRGFISGDMHLHTYTFSGHGDANVSERLISCYAEGLEWLVSTDHNHVVDYRKTARELSVHKKISTSVGNEVSTPIGHFNTYPVGSGSDPVRSAEEDANILFRNIRNKDKGVMIQVNHPRWPSGDYFSFKDLDEFFAETGSPEWSWDFEAFELLNENRGLGWKAESSSPLSVKQDWFHILNQGRRITAVGNSDSHTVIDAIAGVPRNFIVSSTDEAGSIDEKEIVDHIRKGKLTISSGIFVTVGGLIGETLRGTRHSFPVRVQASDWVDCDHVDMYVNGVVARSIPIKRNGRVLDISLEMDYEFDHDSWVVFAAEGDRPMSPLVGDSPVPILPLGVTNPIWIDADNDGSIMPHNDFVSLIVDQYKDVAELLALQLLKDESYIIPGIKALLDKGMERPETVLFLMYDQVEPYYRKLIMRTLGNLSSGITQEWMKQRMSSTRDAREALWTELALLQSKDSETMAHLNLLGIEQKDLEAAVNILDFRHAGEGSMRWLLTTPEPLEEIWESNYTTEFLEPFLWTGNKGSIRASTDIYTHRETSLLSYIYFNAPLSLKVNNHQVADFTTIGQGGTGLFILIPVKKGRNQITVEMQHVESGRGFTLVPIDPKGIMDDRLRIKPVTRHLALDHPYELQHDPSERYPDTGRRLTDGWRGTTSYDDRFWVGFQGEDMVVTIDLREEQTISGIEAGFLRDVDAWIFSPTLVEFYLGSKLSDMEKVGEIALGEDQSLARKKIHDASIQLDGKKGRYIRVNASSVGICPDWHPGRGQKAWIFSDEIIIK